MNPTTVLVIVLVAGYVLWSRLRGQPVVAFRLALVPAILIVWGISDLGHHLPASSGALDVGLVAADVVFAVAIGAWRGATIQLTERNGFLWQQGSWVTLALWGLSIGIRVALQVVGHVSGAHLADSELLLPLMFGLTLAAQSGVVGLRGSRTGIPFAPRGLYGNNLSGGGFSPGSGGPDGTNRTPRGPVRDA